MRVARIKFVVKDEFEHGECFNCPLSIYDDDDHITRCSLDYRSCDCPIELDDYSYAMDEEDITD